MSHSLRKCFASKDAKMTNNFKISSSFHASNHFVRAGVHCVQRVSLRRLGVNSLKMHQELPSQGITAVCLANQDKNVTYTRQKLDTLLKSIRRKKESIECRCSALQTSRFQLNFKDLLQNQDKTLIETTWQKAPFPVT